MGDERLRIPAFTKNVKVGHPPTSCPVKYGNFKSTWNRYIYLENNVRECMSRIYEKAPLVEAVCEIRFGAESRWDLAIPGLIYERLQSQFPTRQPIRSLQAQFTAGPDGVRQELREAEFLQFAATSGGGFVRVGQNVLSVHNVGKYPGWPRFSPTIHEAAKTYIAVASPKNIERIGLRFVNKIEIPTSPIALEDYFNFYPHVGPKLPQLLGTFLVGVEFPYDRGSTVLRLQLAGEGPPSSAVVRSGLDLDYFNSRPESVTLENLSEWLATAHTRIEEIFEAAISDRLRIIFGEKVNG